MHRDHSQYGGSERVSERVPLNAMALRQLVEAECGGANPLVQWTSHFAESKPLNRVWE